MRVYTAALRDVCTYCWLVQVSFFEAMKTILSDARVTAAELVPCMKALSFRYASASIYCTPNFYSTRRYHCTHCSLVLCSAKHSTTVAMHTVV
jgi:hypothetical protein